LRREEFPSIREEKRATPEFRVFLREIPSPFREEIPKLNRMSFPKSTPEVTRWCALAVALVSAAVALFSAFSWLRAESSGVAYYAPSPQVRTAERVTRAEVPEKFQEAVNSDALHGLFAGGIAVIGFTFFRRLGA
jgi:hypothetical protein